MSTLQPSTASPPRLVTADELSRVYNDIHCDLIDGKVYEMAPPGFGHGSTESKLARLLGNFVEEQDLGLVATGETGFLVGRDPDTVLGADVAFVRKERIAAIGVTEKYFPEAPALVAEIVSPNDSAEHVDHKVQRWLAAGAELVWVVYPKGRSVTVYRTPKDVKIVGADGELAGGDVLPGFMVKVAELFAGLT